MRAYIPYPSRCQPCRFQCEANLRIHGHRGSWLWRTSHTHRTYSSGNRRYSNPRFRGVENDWLQACTERSPGDCSNRGGIYLWRRGRDCRWRRHAWRPRPVSIGRWEWARGAEGELGWWASWWCGISWWVDGMVRGGWSSWFGGRMRRMGWVNSSQGRMFALLGHIYRSARVLKWELAK